VKHVGAALEVEAPSEDVWALMAGFSSWPQWGPSIRAVDCDADRVAPGVTGRIQTIVGVWLPFEITEVTPERMWDWKVAGVRATRHSLSASASSRCRVEFTVPWPAAPYTLVLRVALRRLRRMAEER
jgi:hypothetical protein